MNYEAPDLQNRCLMLLGRQNQYFDELLRDILGGIYCEHKNVDGKNIVHPHINYTSEDVEENTIQSTDDDTIAQSEDAEESEQFAEDIKVELDIEKQILEKKVEELETELYFCNRNKRVGEVVDGS